DEVLDEAVLERRRAPDEVDHGRRPRVGDPEAQRPALTGAEAAVAAEPVVPVVGVAGARGQVVARARAPVRVATFEQRASGLQVTVGPLALEDRPLVPLDAD